MKVGRAGSGSPAVGSAQAGEGGRCPRGSTPRHAGPAGCGRRRPSVPSSLMGPAHGLQSRPHPRPLTRPRPPLPRTRRLLGRERQAPSPWRVAEGKAALE